MRPFAKHFVAVQYRWRSVTAIIAARTTVAEVSPAVRQLGRPGGFQAEWWLDRLGKGRRGRPTVKSMKLGMNSGFRILEMRSKATYT